MGLLWRYRFKKHLYKSVDGRSSIVRISFFRVNHTVIVGQNGIFCVFGLVSALLLLVGSFAPCRRSCIAESTLVVTRIGLSQ